MNYSKHRRYLSVEYQAYQLMKKRCYNQRDPHYKYYGGRGIIVCPRWLVGEDGKTGAECFLGDMGPRPPGLTLQRIDREGNYCPENCRWETQKQQQNNRRSNRLLTHAGLTLTIAQWADKSRLPYCTLYARLFRLGWSMEQALTTAVGASRRDL